MVSYNVDLGVVKFYRESATEYSTALQYKIANTSDSTIYAKVSVMQGGNLGWKLDDSGTQVTEKVYTVNPNSVLSVDEKLVASVTPTETQKDSVVLWVEYFRDSGLTDKFGLDIINAAIHIYIQNSDYSWTSTQYPNESDIVFEKWTWDNIAKTSITDGTTFPGALGNAELTVKYHERVSGDYFTVETTPGTIEDYALYFTAHSADEGENKTIFYPTSAGNPITDKFYATVVQVSGRSGGATHYERVYYVYSKTLTANPLDTTTTIFSNTTGIKKVVLYPYLDFIPGIYYYTRATGGWSHSTMTGTMEVVYLFNKLP